jgi:alpha-1,3-rhamnosyl/mannosyltransferase
MSPEPSGVPTVVAGRSCLPEITGGLALMVDPDNVDALALTIERGLTDDIWRTQAIDTG